jgi:hypothetical protein
MTIADIIDFTTATVGDIDQDSQDFARQAIRLRYQLLYGAHLWQESIQGFTVSIANTDTFFLPLDSELIVFVVPIINGYKYPRLNYRERDWIEQNAASSPYFGSFSSVPLYFYRAPNRAMPTLAPGSLTFSVLDTAPIHIYLSGKDATGKPVQEKFSASTSIPGTPTTPVSAKSYSALTTISKDPSTYPVVVTAQDGTVATMSPTATGLVFTVGQLWPALSGSADLWVGAKLRADTLDDDMSVPRISRLWNPLLNFTIAALYKRQRQLGKAQSEFQEASQMVQAAINEEKAQAAFRQQAVPVVYDANVLPWDVGG